MSLTHQRRRLSEHLLEDTDIQSDDQNVQLISHVIAAADSGDERTHQVAGPELTSQSEPPQPNQTSQDAQAAIVEDNKKEAHRSLKVALLVVTALASIIFVIARVSGLLSLKVITIVLAALAVPISIPILNEVNFSDFLIELRQPQIVTVFFASLFLLIVDLFQSGYFETSMSFAFVYLSCFNVFLDFTKCSFVFRLCVLLLTLLVVTCEILVEYGVEITCDHSNWLSKLQARRIAFLQLFMIFLDALCHLLFDRECCQYAFVTELFSRVASQRKENNIDKTEGLRKNEPNEAVIGTENDPECRYRRQKWLKIAIGLATITTLTVIVRTVLTHVVHYKGLFVTVFGSKWDVMFCGTIVCAIPCQIILFILLANPLPKTAKLLVCLKTNKIAFLALMNVVVDLEVLRNELIFSAVLFLFVILFIAMDCMRDCTWFLRLVFGLCVSALVMCSLANQFLSHSFCAADGITKILGNDLTRPQLKWTTLWTVVVASTTSVARCCIDTTQEHLTIVTQNKPRDSRVLLIHNPSHVTKYSTPVPKENCLVSQLYRCWYGEVTLRV